MTADPRGRWRRRGVLTLLGGLGFVAGYAATFLLAVGTVRRDGVGFSRLPMVAAEPAGNWQAVGWLFFLAHRVPVSLRSTFGYRQTLTAGEGPAWTPLLWAVPVAAVALVAAVAVVRSPPERLTGGVARGLGVVPGYALTAAAAVVLVGWSSSRGGASIWIAVSVPEAAAYVGLIYPLVGGAVEGALGFAASSLGRRVGARRNGGEPASLASVETTVPAGTGSRGGGYFGRWGSAESAPA